MIIEVYKSYISYVCIFFLPGFFSLEYGNHTDVSWYIFYLFVSFLRSHSPPEIAEAAETSSPMQGPHLLEPNVFRIRTDILNENSYEDFGKLLFLQKISWKPEWINQKQLPKLLDISSSYLNKSGVFLRPLGFRKTTREVLPEKSLQELGDNASAAVPGVCQKGDGWGREMAWPSGPWGGLSLMG